MLIGCGPVVLLGEGEGLGVTDGVGVGEVLPLDPVPLVLLLLPVLPLGVEVLSAESQ